MPIYEGILEFWDSDLFNKWVETEDIKVYVRRQRHYCSTDTLCLANISVPAEKQQTGIFTELLDQLEGSGIPFFIENVMNSHLDNFLRKRSGYACSSCDISPDFSYSRARYLLEQERKEQKNGSLV